MRLIYCRENLSSGILCCLHWDVLFDNFLSCHEQGIDDVVADDADAGQVARPRGVALHE